MSDLQIVPIAGRDYKTKADIISALQSLRDFKVADISCRWDGKPCNLNDLKSTGITRVWVRHNQLRDKTLIVLSEL
jgi:hypothetical protein